MIASNNPVCQRLFPSSPTFTSSSIVSQCRLDISSLSSYDIHLHLQEPRGQEMQWPKEPTTQHPRKGTIHISSLHVCLYADLSPGKDKLEMHPHFGKTNQLMDVYKWLKKTWPSIAQVRKHNGENMPRLRRNETRKVWATFWGGYFSIALSDVDVCRGISPGGYYYPQKMRAYREYQHDFSRVMSALFEKYKARDKTTEGITKFLEENAD